MMTTRDLTGTMWKLASVATPMAMLLMTMNAAAHQPLVRVVKPDGTNGPEIGCFGQSVLLSGEFAFVGDPCANSATQSGVGAVFRLRRAGSGWIVDRRFDTQNEAYNGSFGWTLALNGSALAIGAPGEGTSGLVYKIAAAKSASPTMTSYGPNWATQRFGTALAADTNQLSGTQFLVGAPYAGCPTGNGPGAAEPLGSAFTTSICPSGLPGNAYFGAVMASHDGMVLIGAPGPPNTLPDGTGSAFLYYMGSSSFDPSVLKSQFVPSDPHAVRFGSSLDFNQHLAVFGAPGGRGQAWVYDGQVPDWFLQAVLEEPVASPGASFGTSVALSGDQLLVGSPQTAGVGALYVYADIAGTWTLQDTFPPDAQDTQANFGSALSTDGVNWIAGAPIANVYQQPNFWTGAVYISADDYLFEDRFGD